MEETQETQEVQGRQLTRLEESCNEIVIENPILRENPIPRNINIEPLNYGYIMRVGCQSLAIESKEDLLKYLTEYLNDSTKTEEKYYNKQLLKHQ